MPRACFSAGCKTGYPKYRREKKRNGEKIPSLFKAPKNPELFELWRKAIPRADRQLTHNDSLCEKHFREEDISRCWEEIINGSTKWQMEKRRPRLKPGTIPCIFSDVPGHSTYMSENKLKERNSYDKRKKSEPSVKKKKAKKTSDKTNIGKIAESKVDNSSNEDDINSIEPPVDDHENNVFCSQDLQNKQNERCLNQPFQGPFMNHSVTPPFSINEDLQKKSFFDTLKTTLLNNSVSIAEKNENMAVCDYELQKEEKISFSFLKKTIHLIEKTNLWWRTVVFDNYIICARWNPDLAMDRKIVILENLKVKVFLKENESSLGSGIKVVSFETLLELIHSVERIRMCEGTNNKEANCRGFLKTNETNLCYNCSKLENRKNVLQPLKILKDQVELIRFKIAS